MAGFWLTKIDAGAKREIHVGYFLNIGFTLFLTKALQLATTQIVIKMTHSIQASFDFEARFHCICSDIGAEQCSRNG